MGGRQNTKGGRGQNKTHTTTPATQKERGEEPGGSRGQRERDTTAPEGVQTCLSGVQKRGQGSYYDEYLSEGAHSTPTTQETWCRGNEPHTGPKAFSAMRHNEEGNQCTTITPSTEAKQPGRRRSNDTQREGPVKPGPRRQGGTSEGE